MFVRTPLQFYALRFALGVAEAGFFPGAAGLVLAGAALTLALRTVPAVAACRPAVVAPERVPAVVSGEQRGPRRRRDAAVTPP